MSAQPHESNSAPKLSTGDALALWAYSVVSEVDNTTREVTPGAGEALERFFVRDRMLCGGVTSEILEAALAGARLQLDLFRTEIEGMTQ